MPFLDYAAHVDHHVSHSSSVGRVTLGLAGAALAVAIVVSGGTIGLVAVAAAAGLGGDLGLAAGAVIDDHFIPPSASNKIVTGFPTVLLGRQQKHAARADPDSRTDCGHRVAEGSKTVNLGPEFKPMARRQDRDDGGGTIVEGLDDPAGLLVVGGDPSQLGQTIDESDPLAVRALDISFALLSLGGSLHGMKTGWDAARAVAETGSLAAKVAGDEQLDQTLGALSAIKAPGNLAEAASQAISLNEGRVAAPELLGRIPE
jgi:hypothetical protein